MPVRTHSTHAPRARVPRHNIYWRDDTLWERVKKAALREFDEEGRQLAASDWLARAAEERLRRLAPDLASDDEEEALD